MSEPKVANVHANERSMNQAARSAEREDLATSDSENIIHQLSGRE